MLAKLLNFRPTDLLAYSAGFLAVIVMVPQLVKTFRLKSAKDVSLPTVCIIVSANLLWGVYGFLIGNLPLMVTSILAFIVALSAIFLILHYRKA